VYAQLLTGPADSATVTVTLLAARLSLVAAAARPAGRREFAQAVARVQASDGVGEVMVTFAASDGGTVTPASAVSTDGTVSTAWKSGRRRAHRH
jgi:hypothetical protein